MKQKLSFFMIFLILCLILSACKSELQESPLTPTARKTPTVSQTQNVMPTPTLQQYESAIAFMEGFVMAWASLDPDELLPYYSEDVKAYDSSAYHVTYTYVTVKDFVSGHDKNSNMIFELTSFFIADDGRFSASTGMMSIKHRDGWASVPTMSMFEIHDGQVIWEYDYYAGSMSETYPLPEIPLSASQHTLTEDESAQIKSILMNWEAAFNNFDLETLSTFYSDQASCINMIAPEWVVQPKDQMLDNFEDKFSDDKLGMILQDFFISANGQYVAVQGEFQLIDETPQPIIMLLELKNGEIIQQYLYLDDPVYYVIFD